MRVGKSHSGMSAEYGREHNPLNQRVFYSGPGGATSVHYKYAPHSPPLRSLLSNYAKRKALMGDDSPYGTWTRAKSKSRKARKASRKASSKSTKLSKRAKMLAHMAKMRRARKRPKTRGSR